MQTVKAFAIRSGAVLLFLLFYFFLLRPLRVYFLDLLVYPVLETINNLSESAVLHYYGQAPYLTVFLERADAWSELVYKSPFDLFFLIAVVAILFFGMSMKAIYYIVLVQLIGGIISLLLLIAGVSLWEGLLFGMDAIIAYLVPGITFIIVVLMWSNTGGTTETEE